MCKKFVEKYNNLSDEELILLIRDNDEDAFSFLFDKYLPLIKHIISKNLLSGDDFDDMLQDATISFYYAAQMFDFHSASFPTFLTLCVERSLKSTLRKGMAKKRIPKELIVSFDEGHNEKLKTASAEETFFDRESSSAEISEMFKDKLSKMELDVLKSFLVTESYEQTAKELNLSKKSVDNALLRVRRKLSS